MSCKDKYLVPVKALSKLIRGKFAARLRRSHKDLYRHVDPVTWSKDWVVHSLHYGQGEPPDGGLLYGLGVADLRADPWLFYMLITTLPSPIIGLSAWTKHM